MRTRGVGPDVQGCCRPSLFEICRFLLSNNLHLPSPFSVSDPKKRNVESCSFPKSFLKSCCRLQELVPCLTLLPIHQVLMRCLLQEHSSGSLSLMPSMARLPPVKPAEYFDLIWSIPLAAVTLPGLHSGWCFASQPGPICSPVLGAPSGKDDVSLNFPWLVKGVNFPPIFCVRAQTVGQ